VPPAWQLITKYAGPLSGKQVCVLASGDNYAAFALAGSGAKVTSVDISPHQLQIAAERAHSLGLTIRFVQADVIDTIHSPWPGCM
jgi:2-polyprenyl-3-methyl-5-hydroxy-6-metoxy-1,4-benzoquinol methylase